MKYSVWANVPDQDHIRSRMKIAECNSIKEYNEIIKDYINKWKGTSNYFRLREPGSFELEENNES
jgi:hypothetical protein